MASVPLTPIVSAIPVTTSWQAIYTVKAPNTKISVDAAVFNNYSSVKAEFSVRLVQSGLSDSLNEIITSKNIRAYGNDLAPALIGQALAVGGIIEVKASVDNSISVAITATTFT